MTKKWGRDTFYNDILNEIKLFTEEDSIFLSFFLFMNESILKTFHILYSKK